MTRTLLSGTALAVCLWVVAPAASTAQPPPLGDPLDLTIRVSVDRARYPLGTTVEITRSICNETPSPALSLPALAALAAALALAAGFLLRR